MAFRIAEEVAYKHFRFEDAKELIGKIVSLFQSKTVGKVFRLIDFSFFDFLIDHSIVRLID